MVNSALKKFFSKKKVYKTLKHKKLPETYGVFHQLPNGQNEIWHSATPHLFPETCTMRDLAYAYRASPVYRQLHDYDLITVKIVHV